MPVISSAQALTLTALSAHAARGAVAGANDPEDAFCRYVSALATDDKPEQEKAENRVRAMCIIAGSTFEDECAGFDAAIAKDA